MQIRAPLGKRGNVTIIKLKYIRSKCAEAEGNKKKDEKNEHVTRVHIPLCRVIRYLCGPPTIFVFIMINAFVSFMSSAAR